MHEQPGAQTGARAEHGEKQKTDRHGRQNEWNVDQPVDQRLADEPGAGQEQRRGEREWQRAEHGNAGNAQRKQERLAFRGREDRVHGVADRKATRALYPGGYNGATLAPA